MGDGVSCMWMRGGISKGEFFLASDLPDEIDERDAFLLRIMGSPDTRQIDGIGGAAPLGSKVAVVSRSKHAGADVDYLFLQVAVEEAIVSDSQNCGNLLAAVGPFALERGLVDAGEDETAVSIYMANSRQIATATFPTAASKPVYSGEARIDGVPGTAAPVSLSFPETAGSSCGTLLPTGSEREVIEGVACMVIDNGMPCIVIKARDLGITGFEGRDWLEGASELKARIETIRQTAGPLMGLGDVGSKSVPEIMLIAPPQSGGAVSVRSFIPHRAHASIGVLGAVTVATACLLANSPASEVAIAPAGSRKRISVEHPTGEMSCILDVAGRRGRQCGSFTSGAKAHGRHGVRLMPELSSSGRRAGTGGPYIVGDIPC